MDPDKSTTNQQQQQQQVHDPVHEELIKRMESNKSAPKLIAADYYDLG